MPNAKKPAYLDCIESPNINEYEAKFIESAINGEECVFNQRSRPDPHSKSAPFIRGDLFAFIAKGGDSKLKTDLSGVRLAGCIIDGDIEMAEWPSIYTLDLDSCHVLGSLKVRNAVCRSIRLLNTTICSIMADDLRTQGEVCLSKGFRSSGPVRFRNSYIGGHFICNGGQFLGEHESLDIDSITVDGSVFLGVEYGSDGSISDAREFLSEGLVNARNISVSGVFACELGNFNGAPVALDISQSKIDGLLWCVNLKGSGGVIDMHSAKIGGIAEVPPSNNADNIKCGLNNPWRDFAAINIDGLEYRRRYSSIKINAPIDWLMKQSKSDLWDEYKPQPFTQMSRVLWNMGMHEEATEVAIAGHRQRYKSRRYIRRKNIRDEEFQRRSISTFFANCKTYAIIFIEAALVGVFDKFIGFGYKPSRAIYILFCCILFGSLLFFVTYRFDGMMPNDPFTLRSEEWVLCEAQNRKIRAECFMNANKHSLMFEEARTEYRIQYPEFHSAAYAIDTFVPLVDLYQETRWTPDASKFWSIGGLVKIFLYIYICTGWVVSAMVAASLTGIVGRQV